MVADMEVKTCGVCKKEFPKTLEYFYKKTQKRQNKNLGIVIYESLQSSCKICKNEKRSKQLRDKYNQDDTYRNEKIKKCKDYKKENKHINTNYHKRARKRLADFYVCSILGYKVNELPKEIIETKRLSLQIKRELWKIEI